VAVERIVWATFFFLIAVVFSTSIQVQFTLPKLFWLRAIAPAIVLLWLVRFRRGEVRPIPATVLSCALALAGWWLVTTGSAVDLATAVQGMHGRYNGLLNHAILLLLFLVVASTATSRGDIATLLRLFVFALVPVSIYAVAQAVGLDPLVWPNSRPGSTIGHPVPLAAVLALAAPFVLAFLITEVSTAKGWRWAAILGLFVFASGTTLSRGPWAGLVVAAGVVLAAAVAERVITLKRPLIPGRDLGFALVALMLVLGLAWPSTSVSRFTVRLKQLAQLKTDPSFMNRFVFFDAAVHMLRDHPILGAGFESYGLLYPRYRPIEPEAVPIDALPTMVHNGYLQWAVTSGLPGLTLYLALVSSVLLRLWRSVRSRPARAMDLATPRELMIGWAFIGAIAGYLVQDLSGWEEISLSAFFWTLLGAAVSFCTSGSPARRWQPRLGWRLAGSVSAVAAAFALVALAFATLREIRADGLFFEVRSLDVSHDWLQIREQLTSALRLVPDDPYYEDAAGVWYLKRLHASGDTDAYARAATLLERAGTKNAFDPYILMHRIDLETAALQLKVAIGPSESTDRAVASVIEMDPNNARVHESVGKLRIAEGRTEDGLASIHAAEALRPNTPGFHMVEGDALRLLGERGRAIEMYRREAELSPPGAPDWVLAEHRLILVLAEAGRHEAAAAEAQLVVARMPADAVAHTLLGIAYVGMDAPEMARASFARALAIDPANAGARQGLAEAQERVRLALKNRHE
jgi:O-antigen ligase/tetratricopeptide (TPR) repeat protein